MCEDAAWSHAHVQEDGVEHTRPTRCLGCTRCGLWGAPPITPQCLHTSASAGGEVHGESRRSARDAAAEAGLGSARAHVTRELPGIPSAKPVPLRVHGCTQERRS